MSWAKSHIEQLMAGRTVSFRPRGHSMRPHIRSGQLVTVEPRASTPVVVGDIVLARVRGSDYLHLVAACREGQVLIANAHGHENGWTSTDRVFGRVIGVVD